MTATRLALTSYVPVPASGRAIVLLHGFPVDHRMWDDVAARLRAVTGLGLVAPDLPGLGASPVPADVPSVAASADAVARTLDDAGVRRAVVVGMSMGGYVAMALLARHPQLVAGIGLVDTKHGADDDVARANRLRVATTVLAAGSVDAVRGMSTSLLAASARETRATQVAALIDDQPPEGIAWSQRAMAARGDSTATLQAFTGPAAVVVGDEDEVTPPAQAASLRDLLADGTLVTVRGAGHLAAMERPDEVADAIAALAARTFPVD